MKTVADVLEVSRSNLIDRVEGRKKKRGRYRKQDDAQLVQEVQKIVDVRPTYGYRRITRLLNKERQAHSRELRACRRDYN
ncbi:IS3 family transposase [Ktedonobacter racemifer]|uniref:HTH-like domain-containing protein n=1 Tax=Ktedonobacter racemifer DSM 44963 TaxID=485913 RepID=D6TKZ3_KTERA|nr:conserved hypothetical protein [Ktedonobacter racemifer DSM 44963]